MVDRRVIVCAGAGGVGKTTVSAALGVAAARRGRRAAVITIDPAKRLADALGLAELTGTPRRVPVEAPGSLDAMVLDQKEAWDRPITERAPTPELRNRILSNPFYRRLSETFAGADAYAAIDTLADLADDDRYDVLIVDTPPLAHAVDFLGAPRRILELLEGRAFTDAIGTMRRVSGSVETLRAAVGVDALQAAGDLFGALAEMFDVFAERARVMEALLASDDLGFVLVSTADQRAVDEATAFADTAARAMDRVVFNRTSIAALDGDDGTDVTRELVAAGLRTATVTFVAANLDRYRERARAERSRIAELAGLAPHVHLPELARDAHDLAALTVLGDRLTATSA